MSTDQTTKNAGMATFYISITAGTNIARALRSFLNAIKYANVKYGEEHYKDYLAVKGHQFKSDIAMARVAFDQKKSNIERFAVNELDKQILKEYAIKYGLDFALTRKPKDLQKLLERKYINHEELTTQEEKIIKAFTYRDENGKTIMNPENPKMPLINKAEYMLTIASVDLDRWELICREMEARSHIPSFDQRLKDGIQRMKIQLCKLKNRQRERFMNRGGRE